MKSARPAFNVRPPKRHRHCKPCSVAWLSIDECCWLCEEPGVDGVLTIKGSHETYTGRNQGLAEREQETA